MDRARGATVDIFAQTLTDRYIWLSSVTDKQQLFLGGLRRPLRPWRRVPVGLLLLAAWVATIGDACMVVRPEASS